VGTETRSVGPGKIRLMELVDKQARFQRPADRWGGHIGGPGCSSTALTDATMLCSSLDREEAEATAQETGKSATGFGPNGKPDFWIGDQGKFEKPVHIAIVAKDRATVDEFYRRRSPRAALTTALPDWPSLPLELL
jgi:hypothetical protein